MLGSFFGCGLHWKVALHCIYMSYAERSAQLAPLLDVALRSCRSATERKTAMWVHGKLALEASSGPALQLPVSAPSVPVAFDMASEGSDSRLEKQS